MTGHRLREALRDYDAYLEFERGFTIVPGEQDYLEYRIYETYVDERGNSLTRIHLSDAERERLTVGRRSGWPNSLDVRAPLPEARLVRR